MKNDEIAALLQALDLKWEQRSELQLENFKQLLEQHTTKTEERMAQASPTPSVAVNPGDNTGPGLDRSEGRRSSVDSDNRDMQGLLKSLRVKIPRFNGTNVDDWVYKINKFFDLHAIENSLRLSVIPFHLEGVPSTWYQWMEKGGSFSDWDSFLQALQLRFGTSIYDDPLGRISKLIQKGKVADYRAEFEALMPRITGVSEAMFLNFFIWGLKLEIRRELLMLKPVDLADAMAKAQLFEDRHEDILFRSRFQEGRQPSFHRTTQFSPGSGPSAVHPTNARSVPTPSTPNTSHSLPIKKLSPAELKERRDKGLCFTCDEKFNFGHKCKNRMLILCGYDEDEPEDSKNDSLQEFEENTEDEVSLNSLSNSMNPRIFRIMAQHGKETLEVLIDTGSHNNFIQEALVSELQLTWEDTKRFKVYMGNGNFLLCSKICRGVELSLQGHLFEVDLYVLPICGLDIVLGMQWLQTLGPCVHDHKALTMEFNWKGSRIQLAGSSEVVTHQLSFTQLHSMLREGEVKDVYKLTALTSEPTSDSLDEQPVDDPTVPQVQ